MGNLEMCKNPAEGIPDVLQRRPATFVKEQLAMYQSGLTFHSTDIATVEERRVFCVRSQSGKSISYRVTMGSDMQLPECQCYVWKSTHRPCKHIWALICGQRISFEDLGSLLTQYQLYNVDSSAILMQYDKEARKWLPPVNTDSPTEHEAAALPLAIPADLPVAARNPRAIRCRDMLQEIINITYLMTERQLEELMLMTEELHLTARRLAPQEDGMPLEI